MSDGNPAPLPDEQAHQAGALPRRLTPPISLWSVMAICAALICVFMLGDPIGDRAVGNVLVLVLSFVAIVYTVFWFSLRSGYPKFLRRLIPLLLLGALVIASQAVRIERLSGTLVPKFVPRWSRSHDELLEQPTNTTTTALDLRVTSARDYPQFLGLERDQQVRGVTLSRDWKQSPPPTIWRRDIGAGWSAFVAVNGFAVTMEQRGDLELTTCYDIKSGDIAWWHGEQARFMEVRGGIGPRSTPAIHDGYVYALGATGILNCLNGADGQLVWQRNVLADVGTTLADDQQTITWGRSGSPLIVDDKVIVPGGGPTDGRRFSLIAYDRQSGEIIWRGGDAQVSYSSPRLAEIDGVRQILIVNEASASSHDPTTGEVLWETDWDGSSSNDASSSQAVPLSDNRVLLSKGYFQGCKVVQVTRDAENSWSVKLAWHVRHSLKTKFTNVCIREPFAFGLSDGILECIDLSKHGQRSWKKGRFGHGQILMVDDLLLVQSENGNLSLVEADSERFVRLSEIEVVRGQAWNHLCLYENYLLMRSDEQAACLELPLHQKQL